MHPDAGNAEPSSEHVTGSGSLPMHARATRLEDDERNGTCVVSVPERKRERNMLVLLSDTTSLYIL